MTLLTGLLSLTAIAAQGQTFQNIGDFTSGNGAWFPNAPLTQGPNGILYGTTQRGGTHGDGNSGGTVFQLALNSSTVTTLYNFCSQVSSVGVCTDGEFINGGLIQDSDGNFYGTTYFGGANTNTGSVFKLTSGGVLTTLYDFCSVNSCADGASPQMGLLLGTDGNFYGTTSSGGAYQSGTVFKITPAGALTTLYSFCGRGLCPNGGGEAVTLVEGSDGEFYGTTSWGGAHAGTLGGGMVFKISSSGTFNTLYSFCALTNCADGSTPEAALVAASDGNFYGTTGTGGTGSGCSNTAGCGTIFKITPEGQLTTLYSFCSAGNCSNGYIPSGLVQGSDGNFYGTALASPTSQEATLFEITASGAYNPVFTFCCYTVPVSNGPLLQASNGFFYGADGGSIFGWSQSVMLAPTFTPTSVNFFSQAIDTTGTRSFVIKNVNSGNAILDFSSFTTASPFAISANTCGTTLTAGKTCKVTVTFSPTVVGSMTGSVSIADNAPGSPQTVPLSGKGELQTTLLPAVLNFPTTKVGTTTAAKTVTLRNNLPSTLTGISYSITGPFAVATTTCTTILGSNTGCKISITFTPTVKGAATGTLTVNDSANNSPQTVKLSGTGD